MEKITKIFVIIQLFLVFFSIAHGKNIYDENQITLVFRYDDPSSMSDWDMERKIIELFANIDQRCTFAVVPNHTTGEVRSTLKQSRKSLGQKKGDLLKQAVDKGVIDIALHGETHQTIVEKEGVKYATEFAGLNFDEQRQKIILAKNMLENTIGITVSIFVPPFNTFDSETVAALEATKFTCISNDTSGDISLFADLKVLPTTCKISELQEVVEIARKDSDNSPLIAVLFHQYDFREISSINGRLSFGEFESIVRWVTRQKDINIVSVGQAVNGDENTSAFRFFLNYRLPDMFPDFLKSEDKRIYHSVSYSLRAILPGMILYLFVFIFIALSAFIFSLFVPEFIKKHLYFLTAVSGILFLFLVVYSVYGAHLYVKGAVLIVCGFAIFIGLSAGCLKMRRANHSLDCSVKDINYEETID